jgi:hypothetical protein
MVMEAVLEKTDFRQVTRLLLPDGWHEVKGLRWVEPYRDGARPNQGVASDWVYWWEKINHETHTVLAPTSNILAFAFGHDDRPVPDVY